MRGLHDVATPPQGRLLRLLLLWHGCLPANPAVPGLKQTRKNKAGPRRVRQVEQGGFALGGVEALFRDLYKYRPRYWEGPGDDLEHVTLRVDHK